MRPKYKSTIFTTAPSSRDNLEIYESKIWQEVLDNISTKSSTVPNIEWMVSRYHQKIIELKKIIECNEVEPKIQKYFFENGWIFGFNSNMRKEYNISINQKVDLIMESGNDVTIIEIKRPSAKLFKDIAEQREYVKKNVPPNASTELKDAIEQIRNYKYVYSENSCDINKIPKLVLIIGRCDSEITMNNIQRYKMAHALDINILTYDDIVNNATKMVEAMQNMLLASL